VVDIESEAGRQAVERARVAAEQDSTLGPGTAGYTTSGAAYRGQEIASEIGAPSPEEPGFGSATGLGYNEGKGAVSGYARAQRPQRPGQ
jgi:hypothetical protein